MLKLVLCQQSSGMPLFSAAFEESMFVELCFTSREELVLVALYHKANVGLYYNIFMVISHHIYFASPLTSLDHKP